MDNGMMAIAYTYGISCKIMVSLQMDCKIFTKFAFKIPERIAVKNQFTLFWGVPARYASMLDSVISSSRRRVSRPPQAIWGVIWQFLAWNRRLSGRIGSVEATSTPAPLSFPAFSASANACSSTIAPLDVLIRYAPGFHSGDGLGVD